MTFPARALDPQSQGESRPLTSWYAEGTSDGIGDRLLMFDNTGTPSLELLRFRRELAETPGFEDALRERFTALEHFSHPGFPHLRAIETLEDGSLALVSTFTVGKRLGELFRSARTRNGIHPAFAAWLIRELTTSLADLQRHNGGTAHGAISPDRIVLTDEGRLVITEHVLGEALTCIQARPADLWREFSLIASGNPNGRARFDCRNDVLQLGYVVLSVLLGRQVAPAGAGDGVVELIDEFVGATMSRAPRLVPALKGWLERALQVGEPSFGSAAEARDALPALRILGGPHSIAIRSPRPTPETSKSEEQPRIMDQNTSSLPILPEPNPSAVEEFISESDPKAVDRAVRRGTVARPFGRAQTDDAPALQKSSSRRPRVSASVVWMVAAGLAIVAIVEAGVIARFALARGAAPAPAGVPILLGSLQPGDAVVVDGREVGVTPLPLTINPNMKSIGIQARTPVAVLPAAVAAPVVDRPDPALIEAARERRGGLRLVTPVEVQVLEGEHVLGSSADGPIVTTVGRHELDFINSAVGYKQRQVVDIKPGQIVRLAVTPPDGKISINAVPWAQVSIDGKAIGETPFANLPMVVGEHQITFRHPQLGEQTQRVVVRSGALTRVSTTFNR